MSLTLPAPSPILAMARRAADLKAAGHAIIDLTLGEPDFNPPPHVLAAAHAALDNRKLGYSPANGLPELRQAIVHALARDKGMHYDINQVAVGCGAKQIIFNAFLASIQAGDEVIIPAPYWASYPDMVRACGGVPVVVPGRLEQGFRLQPAHLQAALNERTRWLIINAPGNPSGVTYSTQDLEALGQVLLRHPQVMILSDDIYAHIHFAPDGHPVRTLLTAMPALKARILTVDGVSKAYAMTGWRVGWGAGPQSLIDRINAVQSQNCTQTSSLSQMAAAAALNGPQQCLQERNTVYRDRRDAALAILQTAPGLAINKPDGAFYLLPTLTGAVRDGDAAADALLHDHGVAVVPGSAFGVADALRLSFATDKAQLVEGCRRIVEYLGKARP